MKRLLAALLLVWAPFAQPAAALPQDPTVAAMQADLQDIGRWSLEHQAAMRTAVQPLIEIESFVAILDRFESRELSANGAVRAVEAWRTQALQAIQRGRAAAEALRPPPSLSRYGPSGAALETALNAARDNTVPTIHELERVINACADVALAAIREPGKGFDARQRALLQAQMQLVRVDLNRLRLTGAAIASTHPTSALLTAMQHYYASLLVVPEYAISAMDGGGDRVALVTSLRQTARDMRATLARATALSQQMREQLPVQLSGQAPDLLRVGLQMVDTFPTTIRAFNGLADNVDRLAMSIENGEDVLDAWSASEDWDAPYLAEIDRLDRVRAQMLADMNGAL